VRIIRVAQTELDRVATLNTADDIAAVHRLPNARRCGIEPDVG